MWCFTLHKAINILQLHNINGSIQIQLSITIFNVFFKDSVKNNLKELSFTSIWLQVLYITMHALHQDLMLFTMYIWLWNYVITCPLPKAICNMRMVAKYYTSEQKEEAYGRLSLPDTVLYQFLHSSPSSVQDKLPWL